MSTIGPNGLRHIGRSALVGASALLSLPRRLKASSGTQGAAPDDAASSQKRGARLAVVIIFAIVAAYYLLPREQSYLVDAQTDILSIVTEERPGEIWELPAVEVCTPRAFEAGGSLPMPDLGDAALFCDRDRNDYAQLEAAEISWPASSALEVRIARERTDERGREARTFIEVFVQEIPSGAMTIVGPEGSSAMITSQTILRFPFSALDSSGVLTFAGTIVLGQTAIQNTRLLLRGGRYEVREYLGLRDEPTLMDSGALSLGERIAVRSSPVLWWRGGAAPNTAGFIARSYDPIETLRVVATSEPAASCLEKARRSSVVCRHSTWLMRVVADPLLVGLATLFSLFGASLVVVQFFIRS